MIAMKKIFLPVILFLLLLPVLSGGCARPMQLEPVVQKQFDYRDFQKIEVGFTSGVIFGSSFNIPVEINITRSENYGVDITANNNIFEFIQISQSGDTLKLLLNKNKILTNDAVVKADITLPELSGLKLTGGILRATAFSAASEFKAEVSGSSRLDIDLQAGKTLFNINSASDVIARGRVSELDATVNGSSTFKSDLQSAKVVMNILSASDVDFEGEIQTLSAQLSGSSTLDMRIIAQEVDLKALSASDIYGSVSASNLVAEASGSSNLKLSGSVGKAELTALSASDIYLASMSIDEAAVSLSGSSTADLQVLEAMDVILNSSSVLAYSGDPRIGLIEVSGDSQITHK
jgi:hypothetical protein